MELQFTGYSVTEGSMQRHMDMAKQGDQQKGPKGASGVSTSPEAQSWCSLAPETLCL